MSNQIFTIKEIKGWKGNMKKMMSKSKPKPEPEQKMEHFTYVNVDGRKYGCVNFSEIRERCVMDMDRGRQPDGFGDDEKQLIRFMKATPHPFAVEVKKQKKVFIMSDCFKRSKDPENFWVYMFYMLTPIARMRNWRTEFFHYKEVIKAYNERDDKYRALELAKLELTEGTVWSRLRAQKDVLWNRWRFFVKCDEMGLLDWTSEMMFYRRNEITFLKLIECVWGLQITYIMREKHCQVCLWTDEWRPCLKMKKCACKQVYYCCVECQKADWLNHKLVCSYIR